MSVQVESLAIPEVKLITPKRHGDARGFFSEVYNGRALAEAGIELDFVQDNHSFSASPHVLRGLHFQIPPTPQAKLVRVTRGRIFDVAVDLRVGSPTYGKSVSVELSAENWCQILVPRGFAHGLLTLEPDTEVLYKVDGAYDPATDAGLRWDDPDLAIDWPLDGATPLLSGKDKGLPFFADWQSPFTYEGSA